MDLIDPDTGIVLATDLTGNGTWDVGGPTFTTGTLAPSATRTYRVRVSVPAGTADGVQDTVRLLAWSSYGAQFNDDARDEITALATTAPVIVTPDNSGIATAGLYSAYAHRVINNTGAADTFDLYVASALGWPTTIHDDTNGDGEYTPGVDLQIANTAFLSAGGSQRIFVVTTPPAGAAAGTRDVSNITAASRATPGRFGAASDTTTVVVNFRQDLSGGGTRMVAPGDTAIYPGTILNMGDIADRFEFDITQSSLRGFDLLNHPTHLYVDTNGDDVPDTLAARDNNGDGIWDVVVAGFNSDGDGFPDVAVNAGATLAYELRRAVDPAQVLERDVVTLRSRSMTNPSSDPDSITATWVFAAVTRASIRGLRVEDGSVTFATGNQNHTATFQLYETDDPTGAENLEPLHDLPVRSPLPDSLRPIIYTVATRAVTKPYLMIEETEVDGDRYLKGPFVVGDPRLVSALESIETRMDRLGVPAGDVRLVRLRATDLHPVATRPVVLGVRGRAARQAVKIAVDRPGIVHVTAAELLAAGFGPVSPATLKLWNQQDLA